ncbi:MAG: tetratricopeptide repeat protein [Pyrinomonadaceae bacterium]
MAFDKTKVVRAAEKYLAQGKIPAAIKEYRAIVEHDASDFTALNMLGDLYARAGNKQEATVAFARIAEHYRGQGFALKAIAMYKKIDRLQPGSIEIAGKLAALYEMQGLIVDARAQYLIVADALSRDGQTPQALTMLRKVADLDSQNVDIRLRLADGYMRENLRTEAGQAYAEAGAQLLARKQYERALDALSKALAIDPLDKQSLSNLVDVHTGLGTADEAAEMLEKLIAENPGDIELLTMLARIYVEAEDVAAAERAALALAMQDASSYIRLVDVARLYLRQGDADAAVRVLASVSEQMLNGSEEETLTELLDEVLARNPEQLDALRLLVRVHTWQHDDEKLRASLEQLAEAAEGAGDAEEERHTLVQLIRLAPEETRFQERLQALGGAPEGYADSSSMSDNAYPAMPMSGEVPTFESFMLAGDEHLAAPSVADDAPVTEFEWNSVAPETNAAPPDASASFSDLNESWADVGSAPVDADASPSAAGSFQEFDFSAAITEPPAVADAATEQADAAATPEARREAMLRQELESVDFYIAQGYADIARDTLEMLEGQFGAHAEIDARREQLQNAAPSASPEAAPMPDAAPAETVEFSGFGLYDTAEADIAPPASLATETPSAADDVDAAFTILESPPPAAPPVSAAPHVADVPIAAEPITSTEATTAKPVAPSPHPVDPGLAAIFDEFRTANEEDDTAVSDGDYETHYNLGLAYKEMDLVDEAVEEFQSAAGLVAPQDGTPRYLQCCNLLGHCFLQKGMPRLAVMWFKKGLDSPGHTEDEYQALRFDLGSAFEQMGELEKAIDTFSEVYGVNVSYRGVADKLRELQAQRAAK